MKDAGLLIAGLIGFFIILICCGVYFTGVACPMFGNDCEAASPAPSPGAAGTPSTPGAAGPTGTPGAARGPSPSTPISQLQSLQNRGDAPATGVNTGTPPGAPICPSGKTLGADGQTCCSAGYVYAGRTGKCCPTDKPALMSDGNTCCPHATDTVQSGQCVVQGYSLMSDGFTQCPTGQVLVSPGTANNPGMCAPQVTLTQPPRIQVSGKPCYVGYYDAGNHQCLPCAAGKTSDGQTCSNCQAGQSSDPPNGQYICTNCPAGKSSTAGGLCTNCPSGTTSTMAGGLCCPTGQTSIAGGPCQAAAPPAANYTKVAKTITNYLGVNDFQIGSDIYTMDTLDNCKRICSSQPGCAGFERQNTASDTAPAMCSWKGSPIGSTRISNPVWDAYIKS